MVAEDGEWSENINSFIGVTHSPNPKASAIIFKNLNMQNCKGRQHTNVKSIT